MSNNSKDTDLRCNVHEDGYGSDIKRVYREYEDDSNNVPNDAVCGFLGVKGYDQDYGQQGGIQGAYLFAFTHQEAHTAFEQLFEARRTEAEDIAGDNEGERSTENIHDCTRITI